MTTNYPPLREQMCSNCRYWRDEQCHRHAPPTAIGMTQPVWPSTDSYDWCGEWAPKEEQA